LVATEVEAEFLLQFVALGGVFDEFFLDELLLRI